jgi:DNA-binding transcriptional MerR regulator
MDWMLPGTVLPAMREDADHIEKQFEAMFLAGGMVLSQVTGITGLEPYTVQNWVKRGFLPKPENKRYSMRQLCRILNINMLKSALPMEEICGLLQYVNGDLSDESDDLIDDSKLYFMFVRLAANFRVMHNQEGRDAYIQTILSGYREPVPGARDRVEKVLRIMITAWAASQLRLQAEQMVLKIKET